MISRFKKFYRKEQFEPSWFSLIFNPYYFNRKSIYNGIKANSKKLSGSLLDFGCGTKAYEHLFEVEKYIGIDLETNDGHDLPSDKIDFFYDGKKLPFKNDTFDSVFSSEVFEHVFNLKDILLEINRVHKKNGLILVTMPFVWHEHEMPNDFGRYTSSGINNILKNSNYEIIKHVKSPSFFLSTVQLFNSYIHNHLLPKNNLLRFILAPLFVFPINLVGLILNIFLPKNDELYINHTILAKNIKEISK